MPSALNETQLMWVEIIFRVLTAPRFDLKRGDLDYVLRNMLAKHTSSQDVYLVSVGVEGLVTSDNEMLEAFETRRPIDLRKFFYGGKSKASKLGAPTLFEHSIPAAVLRRELLPIRSRLQKGELTEDASYELVSQVLLNCGDVVIILKEENRRLARSTMPEGWVFGRDSPLARYDTADPPVLISERFKAYRNEKICR